MNELSEYKTFKDNVLIEHYFMNDDCLYHGPRNIFYDKNQEKRQIIYDNGIRRNIMRVFGIGYEKYFSLETAKQGILNGVYMYLEK